MATNIPLVGNFKVTAEYKRKGDWAAGWHTGIDLVGNETIYSTCSGTVSNIGTDKSYGNYIVIINDEDGRYHWFCHLSKINVKKGKRVERTSIIGIMGNTGNTTGKHLHFEIRNSSNTGNTETIAKAIKEELKNENIVYFGKVLEEIPEADIYFIGSWTDKGNASKDIIEFVKKITNKKIAYFGTAGYGGSESYYNSLFERIKVNIDKSNEVLGYFYCQGKMPIQVRERYVKMMTEHPDDTNLKVSIQNFDEALKHPDDVDLDNARKWVKNIKNTTQNRKNVIK